LEGLVGVQKLDLRNCDRLGRFDPLKPLLRGLSELYLHGTTFDAWPNDINGGWDENVIGKVRAHFADLERGAQQDTELKVLVLGNGGVGKSWLCNRLLPPDRRVQFESIKSTHGIQVKDFPLNVEGLERPARVNLWDFGGQEIYHGSHALFMQSRAVFLIVWHPNMESGEQLDEESGRMMRNRPLSYWLDYVRNVAGSDVGVIVIQGHCDRREMKRPLPVELPKDFAYIAATEASGETGLNVHVVGGMIAEAIKGQLAQPPQIGIGRVEMRDKMREMAATDRTTPVTEFQRLCEANGNVSNAAALLSYFHETGVVFHDRRLFKGDIILDQNWALEAIYALLHRGKTLNLLDRNGRFTRETLKKAIWKDHSDADCGRFIEMMLSCGICFEEGRGHYIGSGAPRYVAPELLPASSDALAPLFAKLKKDPNSRAFIVDYGFLHEGVLRDLMSSIGRAAGGHAIYWKYGCWFFEAGAGCDVIITSEWKDTRGSVTVRALGTKPEDALRCVHGLIKRHGLKLEPEVRTENNNEGFDPSREQPEAKPPPLVAGPPDPERPVAEKQVYLSYAWGKQGEEANQQDRLRAEAADRVCSRLEKEGYTVSRDTDHLKNGDLISEFIAFIGAARNVVAVLSQKYLCSEYCVKELYLLFCHKLQKPEEFKKAVHPVVLSDADLRGREALERYRTHWNDERARLQADFGYTSHGRVMEDHQIEHWIRIMPIIFGVLRDKVSGPVPDNNLDAMIERVLEMLRHTERTLAARDMSISDDG
jgi:internalin A